MDKIFMLFAKDWNAISPENESSYNRIARQDCYLGSFVSLQAARSAFIEWIQSHRDPQHVLGGETFQSSMFAATVVDYDTMAQLATFDYCHHRQGVKTSRFYEAEVKAVRITELREQTPPADLARLLERRALGSAASAGSQSKGARL